MKNFRLLFAIFALFFAQQLSNALGQPLAISANRTFGPFLTGENISIELSATGGVPSYTWNATFNSPTSGKNLPSNLTLNPTSGVITGTINQTQTFAFAARVTDARGNSAATGTTTANPTIKIVIAQPLKISGPASARVQRYQAIVPQTFTASGGKKEYTYSSSGLPETLTINSTTGVVSGNATAAPGTYPATITVTDGNNQTATTTCNVTITAPPTLVWTVDPAPPNGRILFPYPTATLNAATGGTGNLTYNYVSGLPDGLIFNPTTRTISGTPNGTLTTNTTYNVALQVRDSISNTASATLRNSVVQTIPITISPYDLKITGPGNASVQQFNAIAPQTFTASGGKTRYTYSSSGLPGNLTINSTTGVVSGNATAEPGTYPATIIVTDGNNQTANTTCNVTISGIPPFVWLTDPKLPDGTEFTDYNQNLTVSGGVPPYTFVLANGTQPPAGLNLNNSTGSISGKPLSAIDNQTFTVNASYRVAGNTTTISRNFSLTIKPYGMSITGPSEIEVPRLQQPPSNSFSVIGGTANFTWSISPNLPSLRINSAGRNATIAGNATAAPGIYPVRISVRDGGNVTVSQNCTINITTGTPLAWGTPERLPDGVMGRLYNPLTLNATGGMPSYTFSGNNATLSALGLRLSGLNNQTLGGTPNFIGENRTISLSVKDLNSSTLPRAFLLSVYGNLTILPPRNLGSIPLNTPPTITLNASGGKPPYKWSLVTSGSLSSAVGRLPRGLSINSTTGKLEGTAAERGTFLFNVQVTDSANPPQVYSTYRPTNSNPDIFRLVVTSNPPVPSPAQLPIAIIDGDYPSNAGNYSFTFNATGGFAPLTWSTNSTRPGNLSLNPSTGELRGVPIDDGGAYPRNFPLQVKVTGNNSENSTANYTLTVVNRLRITGPPVISDLRGNPIPSNQFTATGGRLGYTYSLVNPPPALSSIISINRTTGIISGALNAPVGDYPVTVRVIDTSGQTANASCTISIRPWPILSIQGPTNLSEYIGNPIPSNQFTASGGKPSYIFSNSTALPASLTLNKTTGIISGNLTAPVGDYPVTIRVTDAAPSSQNATMNCTISIKKWPELVIDTESNLGIVDTVSQHTLRLRASGGSGNYSWNLSNLTVAIRNGTTMRTVPASTVGLVMSVNPSTGLFSYKANASCTANFTLTVREGQRSGTKQMTVRFRDPNDFYIETPYLWDGYIGDSYYQPLSAKNGRNPVKWTATGLGANFIMSEDGVITAKNPPLRVAETLQVTITAKDSSPSPRVDVQTYTLRVTERPIVFIPPQPPVFTEITPGGLTPPSKILSVDDFDGDGLNDILALAQNGAPILSFNQGGWVFRPDNSGLGDRVRPVLVEDLNNDGFPDILSVGNDRQAALYLNSGGGSFERQELSELTGLLKIGILKDIDPVNDISYSDIDKDGDLDLLFAVGGSAGCSIVAVFNTTDDDVEVVTSVFSGVSHLVKTGPGSPKISITDANGDTKPDLVILQTASTNATENRTVSLYLNTGNSTVAYKNPAGGNATAGFTEKPNSGLEGFLVSAFVSVDIDSDGDLDLVNGSTGSDLVAAAPRIFTNDGNGTYTKYDAPVHGSNFAHTGLAVFDANLDGKMDLLWTEVTGTGKIYPRIWRNNVSANGTIDSNSFVDVTADQTPDPSTYWGISIPVASTTLMQTTGFAADLDGDGVPDLAFASTPTGNVSTQGSFKMYRNNADRRNERWLNIQLNGAISPFRGTGARIVVQRDADILSGNGTVTTAKPKVAQLLGPDNGNKAKNNLVFGLAKKSTADRVTVYWSSGEVVTRRENVPACDPYNYRPSYRTLRIPESDALPKPSTLLGRVIPWGASPNGDQNSFTANLTNIVAIAAGGNHNLALRRSGQVVAWGANSSAITVPANLTGVLQIAAGASHSLALLGNGRIIAWGDNSSKQCDVPRNLRMSNQIAAGGNFSLAVSATGGVVVWGANGSLEIQPPLDKGITGNASVLQVAAGLSHALALKNDGTVVAWGSNSSNQTNVPAALQAQVAQIAAGGNHAVALTKNGTVIAWGANNSGQCDVPVGLANVTRIAAGGDQSLALRTDGSIVSWGKGYQNAFKKPISSSITDISAGPEHALALQSLNADFIPENMVSVEGGVFPANTENISSRYAGNSVGEFRISKYEVSLSEWAYVQSWARYFGYTIESSGGKGLSNHPAFSLSWYDALKWCNAKSEMNGLIPVYQLNSSVFKGGNPADPSQITARPNATGFRLPTEKEWEWAARGGNQTKGYRFSGSGNLTEVGWVLDNSINSSVNLFEGRGTWPIGGKAANELGLFDMTGNVWEFTSDLNVSISENSTSNSTVARGGSWSDTAPACGFTDDGRKFVAPADQSNTVGFRLSLSAQPEIIAPSDLDTTVLVGSNATFEFALNRTGSSNLWSVKGDMPPGMSHPFLMNGNANQGIVLDRGTFVINGTPTTPGVYNFTIQVETDGYLVEKDVQITVATAAQNNMVTVQGGTLPAGSEHAGQQVSSFQIGKYEVTWGEWKTVRDWAVANGYTDLAGVGNTFPLGKADNFPVVNVSWYGVVKWCNAKSQMEGLTPVYSVNGTTFKTGQFNPTSSASANGYRLPSEKEWEWAARGGMSSKGYTYSGSNDVNAVAWYQNNSSDGTEAVGTKAANELAIYDMSGNVWEWCEDAVNTSRHLRGGRWDAPADYAAVAYRGPAEHQAYHHYAIGFRLARNDTSDMVLVQGGTLPAGSELAGQTVATFQIGKYEVTWDDWQEVRDWAVNNGYSDLAGVGGTYPDGSAGNFPVVYVNWSDVVKWCNAKSEKEGLKPVYEVMEVIAISGGFTFQMRKPYKMGQSVPTLNASANGYRLPTEKEWEWAAGGGVSSQGYTYSGSNDVNAVAWYGGDNSGFATNAIGTKGANELGIYDMSGNVWEWCEDNFVGSTIRRIRSGGWANYPSSVAVVVRGFEYQIKRKNDLGVRIARSSEN
jgi:formylglycine-generating enzyme required for sulfatase activity